jgi:hypothetical protein
MSAYRIVVELPSGETKVHKHVIEAENNESAFRQAFDFLATKSPEILIMAIALDNVHVIPAERVRILDNQNNQNNPFERN